MANWHDELWKTCKKALVTGGEVRIIFTKTQGNKRIPIISAYFDNYVRCDEETVIRDD